MNANYTIKEIEKKFGFSSAYLRKSIKAGKLVTTQVSINDKGGYKHVITEEALNEWRNNVGAHSSREDGRNKYTLYATPDEFAKLEKLMKDAKLEAPVQRANPSKASE